jgi:hypothetical protein
MKKCITTIIFIVAMAGLAPQALAHVLKNDGPIGVLLHVNPDDDPIVGQPAALLFSVTDSTNRFDPAACNCMVTISEQGKQLFSGSMLRLGSAASIYSLTLPFTFPEKAVYHIVASGHPKNGKSFQNFQVDYDLRVDRGTDAQPASGTPYLTLVIVVIGIFCICTFMIISRKKLSSLFH